MSTNLSLSSYLDSYGHTLALVQYLANELSRNSKQANIPLLGGETGLTITSSEAWQIILTFLRDNNLSSEYLHVLEDPKLASHKKLKVVLDFLKDKETELPLANLAIEKNLTAYQASLEIKATNLDPASPLQHAFAIQRAQIKKYHDSLHTLQGLVFGTTPAEQLVKRNLLSPLLPPPEILSDQELALVQEKLITLLPSLHSGASLSTVPAKEVIYKTLSSLSTHDPALSKFITFNSSDEQKSRLASFVTSTIEAYKEKTGESLSKLEQAQRQLANHNFSSLALPRIEAEKMLVKILTDRGLMPTQDALKFASQLFTESIRSAYTLNRPTTAEELVSSVLAKTSVSSDSVQALTQATSPIFADLLTHNQAQIFAARRHGYVPGPFSLPSFLLPTEVKLALSTHTDPALLSINPQSTLNKLFKQYGVRDFSALTALATQNNNTLLLSKLSFLSNYQTQLARFYASLSPSQQLSAGYLRAKNTLGRGIHSYQEITTKGWDKLLAFQEKLSHFNPISRLGNWWAEIDEKFNPITLLTNKFFAWREKTVSNILQKYKLHPPNNLRGRFLNWATQMYYQGDFTIGGFVLQTGRWAVSSAYHLALKGAKKLGKIFLKKAAGLAIKVLGETAFKQIAGSVIPVIGNALAAIATAISFIKTLWQNRELVSDLVKKGLLALAGIGFAIWSFLAALITKIGAALVGTVIGTVLGFFIPGLSVPLGALGGFLAGLINWGAFFSSLAGFGSSIMSALATAGAQISLLGAGILGVTYFTALTIITAQTTAEIPAPNTYAIFPIDQIECSEEKIPVQSGYEPLSSSAIATRGWEIVSDLYQGFWCYWNRSPGDLPEDVSTYLPSYPELFDYPRFSSDQFIDPQIARNYIDILFWCTWLIQKSYLESGNKVLAYTLGASGMQKDFMSRNKFVPVSQATNNNVVPGSVVFFHVIEGSAGTNHVALVTKVNKDAIYYVQSNGSVKEGYLSFSSSGIAAPSWATIPGFGTP